MPTGTREWTDHVEYDLMKFGIHRGDDIVSQVQQLDRYEVVGVLNSKMRSQAAPGKRYAQALMGVFDDEDSPAWIPSENRHMDFRSLRDTRSHDTEGFKRTFVFDVGPHTVRIASGSAWAWAASIDDLALVRYGRDPESARSTRERVYEAAAEKFGFGDYTLRTYKPRLMDMTPNDGEAIMDELFGERVEELLAPGYSVQLPIHRLW
jgi:hypothetical protein